MSFKHIVDVGFVSTFYRRAPCRSWRICKTEIVIHVTFLNTCVSDVQFLYIAQFTMGSAIRVWAGTEAEDLPGCLEVQRVLALFEPSNRASCVLEDGLLVLLSVNFTGTDFSINPHKEISERISWPYHQRRFRPMSRTTGQKAEWRVCIQLSAVSDIHLFGHPNVS